MISQEEISKILYNIPKKPGVYQCYSLDGDLLYVGKSKNLKKRVGSYFSKKHSHKKTRVLVSQINDVKCVIVSSELDALLLENNLIKQHKPKYNVLLKDDKTYPWICITNERFPKIFQTRKVVQNGSDYYGPYMSTHVVKILLSFFSDLFYDNGWDPFSYVQRDFQKNSEKKYLAIISEIKTILKGDLLSIVKKLKKIMTGYSSRLEFEKAQKIKEKITAIKNHQSKATIVNPKINNVDVFSLQNDGQYSYVTYLKVASGAVIQAHTLELKKKIKEKNEDVLQLAIVELRTRFFSSSKSIYCSHKIKNIWPNIRLERPKIGDKKKLIDLALKNAKYVLIENKKRRSFREEKNSVTRVLSQLKTDLNLTSIPIHIECFDNSNIQGFHPVGSCVVFKNGQPKKKEYRCFNIKTVTGPNDFKSMQEIVLRRYSRLLKENKSLPQLIIVDGGKGQVTAAVKSLEQLNLTNDITVVGIAKKLETLFFANDNIPLYLDKRSTSLKIIQHLRDEAHRFGISFHRRKRKKTLLKTSLDSIDGIGAKTTTKLIAHFGSVKEVLSANKKEVEKLIGKNKTKKLFK